MKKLIALSLIVAFLSGCKEDVKATYIPAGTVFSVKLLNGVDASTSIKEPHGFPLLFKVGNATSITSSFIGCFMNGEGRGELATERLMVDAVNLSCILKNGEAAIIPIKGYVVDENGIVGVKGKLLKKGTESLAVVVDAERVLSLVIVDGFELVDSKKI